MARLSVPTDRLVGNLSYMGSAHHDLRAGGANGIGHPVGASGHARHGPDAGQLDVVIADEFRDTRLGHALGVAVDQEDLVTGRRHSLQNEHPQVWHVVLGDLVVGVIQKDVHGLLCRSGIDGVCNRTSAIRGGEIDSRLSSETLARIGRRCASALEIAARDGGARPRFLAVASYSGRDGRPPR